MTDQQQIAALVAKAMERQDAERVAANAAERATAEQKLKEWHGAFVPYAVTCGARPIAIDHLVGRAAAVFELKDGKVVPRPGVMHPRDPCAELDPITWLADLRTGEDAELLFGK